MSDVAEVVMSSASKDSDPFEVYKATTLALLDWRDEHPHASADDEPAAIFETLEATWARMSEAQHAAFEEWFRPIWSTRVNPARHTR